MDDYPLFRKENVPAYLVVMACWLVVAVVAALSVRLAAPEMAFGAALVWSLVVVMAGMSIMFGASVINLRRLAPGFRRLAEGQESPGIPPVWCPVLTAATRASLQLASQLRTEAGTAGAEKPSARVHISLYSADLERSAEFYATLFGVPAQKTRPGYAEFDVAHLCLRLAIHEASPREMGALNHLGVQFASAQELEAARERLAAAGCATRHIADATCQLAGCRTRLGTEWVTAADGTRWELYAEMPAASGLDHGREETKPK